MKYFEINLKDEFPALGSSAATLCCYLPDVMRGAPDRLRPAILVIPGGGYSVVCDDREGDPIAFSFLKEGYCAFVLKYSIGMGCFPAALLEAAASMLYIRNNAKELLINPEWVVATGGSAGGHLAASLGTLCYDGEVENTFGVDPAQAVPNALVLNYPVISSDPAISHPGSFVNLTDGADVNSDFYKKLSLEKRVTEKTPPTYIWHTCDDTCVPVANSIAFAAALDKAGVKFELHIFPHGPHGMATANFATFNEVLDAETAKCKQWLPEACDFLNTLFGI